MFDLEPNVENEMIPAKKKRGRPFKVKDEAISKKLGSVLKVNNKLTKEQFWKFNCLEAELSKNEEKAKTVQLAIKNLEKDAELIAIKMQSLKGTMIGDTRKKIEDASLAFNSYKLELENIIGESLNGATINEKTLEITKL